MSIFDSIKSALGGGKPQPEDNVTMAPSQVLRNAGIDTSRLDLSFGTGSITVSGEISDEAERDRILDLLAGIPGIDTIEDSMVVAAAVPEPEPQPESEAVPEPDPEPAVEAQTEQEEPAPAASEAPAGEAGGRTYTVQSGDTLWKIAEETYGSGAQYHAIFEANRDVLDDPDRIFPGQVLKLPELDD